MDLGDLPVQEKTTCAPSASQNAFLAEMLQELQMPLPQAHKLALRR